MPRINEILTELVAVFAILRSPAYQTHFPQGNVHPCFSQDFLKKQDDRSYPKAFIILDEGDNSLMPSSVIDKKLAFTGIVVVKQRTKAEKSPDAQLAQFIDDIEKALYNSSNLSALCDTVVLSDFSFDSGYAYPEGVCVFRIEVSYKRDFNTE